VTAAKKGAEPGTYRIRALLRHDLAARIVATIVSADIAAYRDERLAEVAPGSVKRELVILGHLFETVRNDRGIRVDNPLRRAGIEGPRFHDLRREATSRLLEPGLNTMEMSGITAHEDLPMPKRSTHLRAEDLARKLP